LSNEIKDNTNKISKQVDELTKDFESYAPDIRRFRINYEHKSSEINYLLSIQDVTENIKIKNREIRITQIIDMLTGDVVGYYYDSDSNEWIIDLSKLVEKDKILLTIERKMPSDFVESLVNVTCSANPTKEGDNECYWIHSALKNVRALESIWSELDVDQINVGIRIGVERYFSSVIPREIKERLRARKTLLDAIQQGARTQRLQYRYRQASNRARVSPSELVELMMRLVSGEYFANYLSVDDRFEIAKIEPYKQITSIVPERVNVGVLTDLNFLSPAAQGKLTFLKKNYVDKISDEINKFIPEK
jgi:hypothetical protein